MNVLAQITFRGAPLILKWWKLNRFMNAEEMFRFWYSLHIILHFPRYNMKKSLLPCECGQSDYLQRNFNESKLNYIHADPRSFKKLEVIWKNIIICSVMENIEFKWMNLLGNGHCHGQGNVHCGCLREGVQKMKKEAFSIRRRTPPRGPPLWPFFHFPF